VTTAEQLRIERRSGHRFEQYQVPVILRAPDGRAGNGFTLNLSSRGALVRTDFPMTAGQSVEITLAMPSEISMVENGSVRCRARVLRLHTESDHGQPAVALRIEHYEFLPRDVTPVHVHSPAPVHASRV
jgi:PilZ domain